MLDIVPGDVLVVAGREYPVKAAAAWTAAGRNTLSMKRAASVDASTKRTAATGADGKRASSPTTYLSGLRITPLDPMSGEKSTGLLEASGLDTPAEALQTFVADGTGFVHLIVEDLLR